MSSHASCHPSPPSQIQPKTCSLTITPAILHSKLEIAYAVVPSRDPKPGKGRGRNASPPLAGGNDARVLEDLHCGGRGLLFGDFLNSRAGLKLYEYTHVVPSKSEERSGWFWQPVLYMLGCGHEKVTRVQLGKE